MIWHVVRFDFDGIDPATRAGIEERLAGLGDIDVVAWLRLARDLEQEHVTGLVTIFATVEDLATYRTHPDHLPVVRDIGALGVGVTRFDLSTDDDVADLPT